VEEQPPATRHGVALPARRAGPGVERRRDEVEVLIKNGAKLQKNFVESCTINFIFS
jgi:hypothetical protein